MRKKNTKNQEKDETHQLDTFNKSIKTYNSAAMGAAYGANLAEGYTNNCNC